MLRDRFQRESKRTGKDHTSLSELAPPSPLPPPPSLLTKTTQTRAWRRWFEPQTKQSVQRSGQQTTGGSTAAGIPGRFAGTLVMMRQKSVGEQGHETGMSGCHGRFTIVQGGVWLSVYPAFGGEENRTGD